MSDDLHEHLVQAITNIITKHQVPDYYNHCKACNRDLYGAGGGASLSRHRAEKIVDELQLVWLFTTVGETTIGVSHSNSQPRIHL